MVSTGSTNVAGTFGGFVAGGLDRLDQRRGNLGRLGHRVSTSSTTGMGTFGGFVTGVSTGSTSVAGTFGGWVTGVSTGSTSGRVGHGVSAGSTSGRLGQRVSAGLTSGRLGQRVSAGSTSGRLGHRVSAGSTTGRVTSGEWVAAGPDGLDQRSQGVDGVGHHRQDGRDPPGSVRCARQRQRQRTDSPSSARCSIAGATLPFGRLVSATAPSTTRESLSLQQAGWCAAGGWRTSPGATGSARSGWRPGGQWWLGHRRLPGRRPRHARQQPDGRRLCSAAQSRQADCAAAVLSAVPRGPR